MLSHNHYHVKGVLMDVQQQKHHNAREKLATNEKKFFITSIYQKQSSHINSRILIINTSFLYIFTFLYEDYCISNDKF